MFYQIKYLCLLFLIAIGANVAGCSKSEQASPTSASSTANVSDFDVTEHVKTVLDQNDALKRFDIQVITLKGDVRLIGEVDTQAHIDEAVKIARAAEGTHTIHNELRIKK